MRSGMMRRGDSNFSPEATLPLFNIRVSPSQKLPTTTFNGVYQVLRNGELVLGEDQLLKTYDTDVSFDYHGNPSELEIVPEEGRTPLPFYVFQTGDSYRLQPNAASGINVRISGNPEYADAA